MRRMLTLLLVAAALAACGSDKDAGALDWPSADDPTGTADGGLVWADRTTGEIHLADGTTLSADQQITSFVVAGRGAYVVDDDETDPTLIEVTSDGPRPTGAHTRGAKASPDGRYLAYLDTTAGPLFQEDPTGDVHLLTSVVVDLEDGEEVFRSTRGMGDPKEDDLMDLYEDASYGVLGITDETAWIKPATGDILAIDLSSGDVSTVPDRDTGNAENPWVGPRLEPGSTDTGAATSDGSWGIRHISRPDPDQAKESLLQFAFDELEAPDGTRLVPRVDAHNWRLEQWVDDTTVAGFADRMLDDPELVKDPKPSSLMTCTVPDGACTLVPDSEDAILPVPNLY